MRNIINCSLIKTAKGMASIQVLAIFLLCMMFVGLTAGFMTSADGVINVFTIGHNTSEIEEEFGEYDSLIKGTSYTKKVCVRNIGDVPCYARVFAEIENPDTAKSVSIDFNTEQCTEKQADGYYYYKGILDSGAASVPLFTTITANEEVTDFRMICYSETVQAEGFSTAAEAFANIR